MIVFGFVPAPLANDTRTMLYIVQVQPAASLLFPPVKDGGWFGVNSVPLERSNRQLFRASGLSKWDRISTVWVRIKVKQYTPR